MIFSYINPKKENDRGKKNNKYHPGTYVNIPKMETLTGPAVSEI